MAPTRTSWPWLIAGFLLAVLLVSGGLWALFGLWFAFWGLLFWALPFLLLATAIVGVGYLAYRARRAKEEAPVEKLMAGPDPLDEMSRLTDEMIEQAQAASASLERTRQAMDEGLRG